MPFNRSKLPDPLDYYQDNLEGCKRPRNEHMLALCPFHNESHPSFSVNTETGSYKCFSCGARGGDVLKFHQEVNHLSFIEACKQLGAWD